MVDCPAIDEWFRDSTGKFQGIVRVSDLEKGHKFFIENYCENIYAVRFAIRGENIFTDTDPRNPYIAFHLTCDADVEGGAVSFSYNIGQDSLKTIPYPSPIKIISVFPEPDIITPTVISFNRSFNQIKEHGLYFIAEDLSKSKENQVRSFIDSVLMGVYLSLFIQFLFSLLKNLSKWLNDREQRRKSKEVQ